MRACLVSMVKDGALLSYSKRGGGVECRLDKDRVSPGWAHVAETVMCVLH